MALAEVSVVDSQITVEVGGTALLAPLLAAAAASAAAAAASEVQTGEDAESTAADVVTASGFAAAATAMANPYASIVAGLAGTANGGVFSVPQSNGAIPIYKDNAGTEQLLATLFGTASDIVGRPVVPLRLIRNAPPGLRIHRDLLALQAGDTNQFGIFLCGDSLSDTSWPTCGTQVQRNIAEWMPTSPVYGVSASNVLGFTAPAGVGFAAGTIYPISGKYTGTYHEKARYDLAFDGTAMELEAGEYAIFAYGGETLYGDYLLIPLITGPAGGMVRVRYSTVAVPIAGSTWNDPTAPQIVSAGHSLTGGQLLVDTYSATPGLTMVRLNIGTFGPLSVRQDHSSGGSVFSLKCQTAVKSASSIPTYRMSSPSNDFIYADMDCVPIMGDLIAELDYPIIWVASDDTVDSTLGDPSTGEPYAAYATFLPVLEAAIAASGLAYPPQVVLEGNPYLSNGVYRTDAVLGARIDYCWDWCQGRVGWDVLDMLAMTGGLSPTVDAGLNGDSSPWIHYAGTLPRIATDAWWDARGFRAPRGRRPGGDATTGQVLIGGSTNVVNAETVMDALVAPRFDTATFGWSAAVTSGGSMTLHTANTGMRLATSIAVGGAVRAHINVAQSPMGKNQGNLGADVRRVGCRLRMVTTGADAVLYALLRSGGAYDSAAAGPLTAAGYGFRVINGTIVGTCWGGLTGVGGASSLKLSTDVGVAQNGGSVALVTGGAADYVDGVIRLFPGEVNASRGRIQWWVNGVLIGEASYDHASTLHWGYELMSTNGATTSFTADVSFPVFVMSGDTAA